MMQITISIHLSCGAIAILDSRKVAESEIGDYDNLPKPKPVRHSTHGIPIPSIFYEKKPK